MQQPDVPTIGDAVPTDPAGPDRQPLPPPAVAAQPDPEPDRLLSLLLTKFPNLPPDRIPPEMCAMLGSIVECFQFDGCGLMRFARDKAEARAVHYCDRSGEASEAQVAPLGDSLPWTRENLLNGNIVCFATTADLPQAAAADRVRYERDGIVAYLAIPIYVRDSVDFFLIAHHRRCDQVWRKETISLLRLIGELFVMSLDRRWDESELNARLQFEQLLSQVSGRLINVTGQEVDGEIVSTLKQVRGILGFDRFGVAELSPDRGEVVVTHAAYGEGVAPLPEKKDLSQLFPWAKRTLLRGETVLFSSVDELPADAGVDKRSWQSLGVKGNLTLPIHVAGSLEYLLIASYVRAPRAFDAALLPTLRLLGELIAGALLRCRSTEAQQKAREEIRRLEERLQSETEHRQCDPGSSRRHDGIIGESAALATTLALTEQVAPTDSTVLISGETGTGKELVAQAIHKLGARRSRPMVKVNCASLPAALVESELFGREKGAYTGALTRQAGRFELADGGTIFLDEIAEMSLELQAKLLRVLQEGQFERLGSAKTIQVDVRVIAATNRNLADEVARGRFREDLYYRLNVFQIVVPPLRERVEDIPLLVWSFVQEFGEKMGKKINKIGREDMAALQGYQWPGNVRELRNVVEHAVIVSSGEKLQVRLPGNAQKEPAGVRTLEEYEVMHIKDALRLSGWRIKGDGGAARLLGLNPSTLYSRMQKLGISSSPAKDEISH